MEKIVFEDHSTKMALTNKEKTAAKILAQTEKITLQKPELMQWRIDYFEDVTAMNQLLELAPQVKEKLQDIPLLVTFRSQKCGGNTELDSEDAYLNLVKIAIDFKLGDAIDIEMDHTQDRVQDLIQAAHKQDLKIVIN